jgi:RNA polymerase sigma factor (sigma-70 family)
MNPESLQNVLAETRQYLASRELSALSDGELLERFAESQDEGAFGVLLERHGDMVPGVCRRCLKNHHDAEDACQTTFLLLARKAKSVHKSSSLGCWLHGVALRVCANFKRARRRQADREKESTLPSTKDVVTEVSGREIHAIIDEEIQQLPQTMQAPLILCYLEGKTRDEAAQELGWSLGRLRGYLDRGRNRLRERLIKRGLSLSAILLEVLLTEGAQANPGASWATATTSSALAVAQGKTVAGLVSAQVLSLFHGVIKTMFIARITRVMAAIVVAAFLVTGIGVMRDSNATGDEKVNPLNSSSPLTSAYFPWPFPHEKGSPRLHEKSISLPNMNANHIAIDPTGRYLVAAGGYNEYLELIPNRVNMWDLGETSVPRGELLRAARDTRSSSSIR